MRLAEQRRLTPPTAFAVVGLTVAVATEGLADEIICCPIPSEQAHVIYESVGVNEWASVDIQIPRAVVWTETSETDGVRNGNGAWSCTEGQYSAAPPSTDLTDVFEFEELYLSVEPERGDSERLKLDLPVRTYGSGGTLRAHWSWANHRGDSIWARALYMTKDEVGACPSWLEFEVKPPDLDADVQDRNSNRRGIDEVSPADCGGGPNRNSGSRGS